MSGGIAGKRVILIDSNQAYTEHSCNLLYKIGIKPHIASTIHSAISQMMISTFDVVALDTAMEDAACLIGPLLDLRHAKNTLLLLFPVEGSDMRASFLSRGFDMCLPVADPRECAAAIYSLLRRPPAHEYPTGATPPGRIIYKDLAIDPLRQKVMMKDTAVTLTTMESSCSTSWLATQRLCSQKIGSTSGYGRKIVFMAARASMI